MHPKKRKRQALQDEMSDEDTTDITAKKNNVSKAPFAARKKKKNKTSHATTSATASVDENSCKVIVKQRVNHKKSLYLLEQLILKHSLHEKNILLPYNKGGNLISFKEISKPRGVEFILNKTTSAEILSDFICKVLPCEKKKQGSNFSLEIAPICKYDLICLPKKMYQSMGSFGPICVCERIQNDKIMLLDVYQLQLGEIDANTYFQIHTDSSSSSTISHSSGTPNYLFLPLHTSTQLIEYTVIGEMEDILLKKKEYCLGMVQVCKTSELGHSDSIKTVKCHFAHYLQSGDTVLGYDLANSNVSDENLEQYKQLQIEDVILVKKVETMEKENRIFQLKNWKMQFDEDYEEFLNELENDPQLRQSILLFKNPQYKTEKKKKQEPHKIQLEELLDGMNI